MFRNFKQILADVSSCAQLQSASCVLLQLASRVADAATEASL